MDKILDLKGPDRVRKRPHIFFNSADLEGAKSAVATIFKILEVEAKLGHCKHIRVDHNGEELSVIADGRGIVFDVPWYSNFIPESYKTFHQVLFNDPEPVQSCGWGELYCTVCASAFMNIVSVRKGEKSTASFEKGNINGDIRHEKTSKKDGTTFQFQLDPEVFEQTEIPADFLLETLKNIAKQNPKVACSYTSEEKGKTVLT